MGDSPVLQPPPPPALSGNQRDLEQGPCVQASGFLTLRSPAEPGSKKGKKEGLREGVCCERGGCSQQARIGNGKCRERSRDRDRGEKTRKEGRRRKRWRSKKRDEGHTCQLSQHDFPHFRQMGKLRLREVKRLVQGPSHRSRVAEQESAGLSLHPLNYKHLNKTQGGRTTREGRGQGRGLSAREKVLSCYLTFREQGQSLGQGRGPRAPLRPQS